MLFSGCSPLLMLPPSLTSLLFALWGGVLDRWWCSSLLFRCERGIMFWMIGMGIYSASLRLSERLLGLDDCEVGLRRERLSERKLQRGQDAPFLQNGYIKCPSQEIPARGGERIRYLFFCMTVTAVVRITGVMLLATCGIGATYACTFLFLFSDVEQCCTNNNYH